MVRPTEHALRVASSQSHGADARPDVCLSFEKESSVHGVGGGWGRRGLLSRFPPSDDIRTEANDVSRMSEPVGVIVV